VFPRDIVCLRNISINALHKGDDDDDDEDEVNPDTLMCLLNSPKTGYKMKIKT